MPYQPHALPGFQDSLSSTCCLLGLYLQQILGSSHPVSHSLQLGIFLIVPGLCAFREILLGMSFMFSFLNTDFFGGSLSSRISSSVGVSIVTRASWLMSTPISFSFWSSLWPFKKVFCLRLEMDPWFQSLVVFMAEKYLLVLSALMAPLTSRWWKCSHIFLVWTHSARNYSFHYFPTTLCLMVSFAW